MFMSAATIFLCHAKLIIEINWHRDPPSFWPWAYSGFLIPRTSTSKTKSDFGGMAPFPSLPYCAVQKVFQKFWKTFDFFLEIRGKQSISHTVRTPWHVRNIENYAMSKFQPPTTLGDPQNVEKAKRKFLKDFADFFENFTRLFNVFARFSKYSGVFRPVWMRSDLLGCMRTHSDAFGIVRTHSTKRI